VKKYYSEAYFLLKVTGVCWGLFFLFSFQVNWTWNDLTVITGILSAVVTFALGIIFGQEIAMKQFLLAQLTLNS